MRKTFARAGLFVAIAAASASVHAAMLEEVIVTAQKRSESLQDVPISITALSGEMIEDASIRAFKDLNGYIPNFSVSENAVNTTISMRGISIGAQQSFEQSVGIFVDGVHYGKGRQARLGIFDLEQVEVLRGPQGILFGKNTLAGAVNIRTAAPEVGGDVSGRLAASFESYDGQILEGYVNIPISDDAAMRISVLDRESDGYNDNTAPNAPFSSAPSTDESIYRIGIQWEPTDSTDVGFRYTYSDFVRVGGQGTVTNFDEFGCGAGASTCYAGSSDQAMYATMALGFPTFAPSVDDAFTNGLSIGGAALDGRSSGPERLEGTDTQNHEFSLNVEHTFDNGMTFTSVTGYSEYEFKDGIDADFLPVTFIGRSDNSEFNQKYQEFRIASDTDGAFSWIAGANYVESVQEIDRLVVVDGTLGNSDIMNVITTTGLATNRLHLLYPELATVPASLIPAAGGGTLADTLADAGIPTVGGNVIPGTGTFLAFNPCQVNDCSAQGIEGAGLPVSFYGQYGLTAWDQLGRLSRWQQDTESYALFAQGRWDLSDSLTLTAGFRYTEETKDVYARMDLTNSSRGIANPAPYAESLNIEDYYVLDPSSPTGVDLAATTAAYTADYLPLFAFETLSAASFDSYGHEFRDSRTTDQTTFAATLNYTPNDDSLYYLSYAEGFKSGGFNSVDDQNPAFAEVDGEAVPLRNVPGKGFEYGDERAWSVELGGKHTLLDGAMNFNWNVFSSVYEDLQVSTFVGLGFVVANAAEANISGLEIDATWQVTEKLRANLSLGLLDGEYDSFPGAGCTAAQQNALNALAADDWPSTSALGCTATFQLPGDTSTEQTGESQDLAGGKLGADYSGSLGLVYEQPLSGGMAWFTQAEVNFTDGFYMTGDLDPVDFQPGFEKINLRTGVRADNWMVMVYGRNITDELTAAGAADVPLASGSHFQYRSIGAVWGVQGVWNF